MAAIMAQTCLQKCDLCAEVNGNYYCYECQHVLCTICRERHDKIPAIRGHTIIEMQRVDLSTFSNKAHCSDHEKEFSLYCEKCECYICIKCGTSTHKGHSFSEITNIAAKERASAQEKNSELKMKVTQITDLQEMIKSEHLVVLQEEAQNVLKDIESTMQELQNMVDSQKEVKITEVDDRKKLENENLQSFLKDTDEVHEKYMHICSQLENLLLESHDVSFSRGFRVINEAIANLDKIPEKPECPKIPEFNKELFFRDIMEHIQVKFDVRLCCKCEDYKQKIDHLTEETVAYEKMIKSYDETIKLREAELFSSLQENQHYKKQIAVNAKQYQEKISELQEEKMRLQRKTIRYQKQVEDLQKRPK